MAQAQVGLIINVNPALTFVLEVSFRFLRGS